MQIKLHYRQGDLYYINGEYVKDSPQPVQISLQANDVLSIATNALRAEKYIWQDDRMMELLSEQELAAMPTPELVYAITQDRTLLAYRIEVFSTIPLSRKAVYIDPTTKEVIKTRELTCSATGTADTRYSGTQSIETEISGSDYVLQATNLSRGIIIKTLNIQNSSNPFVDNDNDWTAAEFHNANSDDAALDAHWGMEKTYDYFKNVHNRNSYDGTGGQLLSQIHNNDYAGNAAWLYGGILAFGDAGDDFDIMTCLDIVAHEVGHAISDAETSLGTTGETGAINEGLADIWGACVEYYTSPGKQRWQLMEDVDLRVGGNGARSVSNPNSTGEPDTYAGLNWVSQTGCTPNSGNDNCGVHTNMGVMSHWFYRLTEGGSGTNDNSQSFSVTGIGIEDAADIVYRAETVYLTASTNYSAMRSHTIKAAQDIYGYCSPEVISVIDAWHAVGVGASFNALGNLTVVPNINANTTQDFYSPDILQAANTIDGVNTNIRYRASGAVILQPGFVAEAGSNFIAEIIPCDDLSAAKKELSEGYGSAGKELKKNDMDVNIYPNPVDEQIYILVKLESFVEGSFVIVDIAGREILQGDLKGQLTQIDTRKLTAGTYIINTKFNKFIVSHKLVKL